MKLKFRVIFLGFLTLIIVVSFKILEPEIGRHGDIHGRDSMGAKGEPRPTTSPKDILIQQLVKKYSINFKYSLKQSPWMLAASWVSPREIHPEITPELGGVLREMAIREVTAADVGYKGTQLKLSLMLKGGQRVAFKPKWFERNDVITGPPYAGADRHNGEIAAFHLGRILEFRRTPLVVGRRLNLVKEVMPVASPQLLKTFFKKDNRTCFYGKCRYCRGREDGVCGSPDVMEGAVVLWLPRDFPLKLHKHPWSRTYRDGVPALWEKDEHYCSKVKLLVDYSEGPLLLDIMDTAILDFLIGNADRHHFETFDHQPQPMLLMLDNAKSFGNPHLDEETILAPLYQCCVVRFSTWQRLLILQDGVLGAVLRQLLQQDPVAPILAEEHVQAVQRRLRTVLQHIDTCIQRFGLEDVAVTGR